MLESIQVSEKHIVLNSFIKFLNKLFKIFGYFSQTCVQLPPLGPKEHGHQAEVYMKKISGI
jgi:hypothetical protein